jgi:VanZ family protein
MALIFVLSAQPGLRVTEDASVDRPLRTLAHLATYAVLAGLLVRALAAGRRPLGVAAVAAWLLAVLYGITDEMHQAFVPDRTGRPADVVVDAVGAAIGVAGAMAVSVLVERRRRAANPPADLGQG